MCGIKHFSWSGGVWCGEDEGHGRGMARVMAPIHNLKRVWIIIQPLNLLLRITAVEALVRAAVVAPVAWGQPPRYVSIKGIVVILMRVGPGRLLGQISWLDATLASKS